MPATIKLISLGILVAAVASTAACVALPPLSTNQQSLKGIIVNQAGNGTVGVAPTSKNSNTLIIQLQPNNPIREIIIDEGFVNGGGEPIFEIDGNPGDSGNGTIRIGTLTMDTVDAKRLEIRDTQVVTSNITNVVAHDDELDLAFTTVTVILVAQGANSTISHTGFRVDRVRILGLGGAVDTNLERLTVTRSSFFGTIRIDDAQIQTLILKNISLED